MTTARERSQAYVAEILACHRCAAGDREMAAFTKDNADTAGLRTFTRERPEEAL